MILSTKLWIEVLPVWSEYGGLNRWQTRYGKVRKTEPAPEEMYRYVEVPVKVDVASMFAGMANAAVCGD